MHQHSPDSQDTADLDSTLTFLCPIDQSALESKYFFITSSSASTARTIGHSAYSQREPGKHKSELWSIHFMQKVPFRGRLAQDGITDVDLDSKYIKVGEQEPRASWSESGA
jgi:hypothetical protein